MGIKEWNERKQKIRQVESRKYGFENRVSLKRALVYVLCEYVCVCVCVCFRGVEFSCVRLQWERYIYIRHTLNCKCLFQTVPFGWWISIASSVAFAQQIVSICQFLYFPKTTCGEPRHGYATERKERDINIEELIAHLPP